MSITSITPLTGDTRLQGLATQQSTPRPLPAATETAKATETKAPPAVAPVTAPTPEAAGGLEEVQQAVEEVRKAITPVAQDLLFSIDEDTGKTVVKVVDASTDEVIRQIPSEEIISIAKAIDKLQGLLVQQKA